MDLVIILRDQSRIQDTTKQPFEMAEEIKAQAAAEAQQENNGDDDTVTPW